MGLHKSVVICALCAALGMVAPQISRAAEPATTQARTQETIIADLQATSATLHGVLPSLAVIADDEQRKLAADKAIPVLKKMEGLLVELANVQTDPSEKAGLLMQKNQFDAFLVAFGDKDTTIALEDLAKNPTTEKSVTARTALLVGNWWRNSKDAIAQAKALADFTEVAKANPADENIASTLGMMWELGAADEKSKQAVLDMIRANLKGDTAKQILAQADAIQAQKDLEGKPLVVAGRTTTGGTFSSADWKGKVILVDMWATWCGPCKEELPRTKKLYDDYHAKGLEVLGLDCDTADDVVNAFTKENVMPWPEMRELSQNDSQWHPLATQWHVEGIPTMFIIDRQGVLRYVDGREDTEAKVKALLAEGQPK